MNISVLFAPTDTPAALGRTAVEIADTGMFCGIWTPDHLYGGGNFHSGRWLSVWAALSALSDGHRMRVGTLVSGVPLRPAATLAREFTAQLLERGAAAVCGIGAGAHSDAALTGRPVATSRELGDYARCVREHLGADIGMVVAAGNPNSLRAAADAGGWWVTSGRWGTDLATKAADCARLLAQWRELAGSRRALVLVDVADIDPWQRGHVDHLTDMYAGFDELVVWHPAVYAHRTVDALATLPAR